MKNIYGISVLAFIAIVVLLVSCADPSREYSSDLQHFEPTVQFTADVDMYVSPSLETYGETDLFSDNMTARHPVPGTIPRGHIPYLYENTNEGYKLAGDSLKNPIAASPEVIEKGKDLYIKFCVHCHGDKGNGDGIIIKNEKFPPPPSYLTGVSSGGGALLDLPEGKMFHSITYGRNLMGSHASQLNADERWLIIHYIKDLQKSATTSADMSDVETEPVSEPDSLGK